LPSGDACPPAGGSDIDDSTPPATEYGLAISRVLDGSAAAKAGLRAGDILLSIGADRVQSFDEMVAALAKAAGNVDVIFVNGESGQTERMPVTPAGGKLGVAVEPVPLD
jgi:S1-C subfamily serine protease